MSQLSVRRYRPGDEIKIQELFNSIFRRSRSMDEWRWRYQEAPYGPALILLLCSDDRIVGHLGYVRFPTFIDGHAGFMSLGGDNMVARDFRGRGGMGLMVEAALSADHRADGRIGFPTAQSAALAQRHGGQRYIGSVRRWVRLNNHKGLALNIERSLPALGARLLRPLLSGWNALARVPRTRLVMGPIGDPGEEVDALAQASAAFARCIRVRDSAYVRWRWLNHPSSRWMVTSARTRDGELRGWVVYSDRPGDDGRGRIVDVLARDAAALRALLVTAADALSKQGCHTVTLDYQDPRWWSRWVCFRAGFVRRGHGFDMISRAITPRAGGTVESLRSWYLTRGDSDLA